MYIGAMTKSEFASFIKSVTQEAIKNAIQEKKKIFVK